MRTRQTSRRTTENDSWKNTHYYRVADCHVNLNRILVEQLDASTIQNGSSCSYQIPRKEEPIVYAQRIPTILCLILATKKEAPKVKAVSQTWTRRCDKTIFLYGAANKTHLEGDKLFIKVPEERDFLPAKMKAAFQAAYKYFNSSFDWFLKADVDTYMIMENLRLLLLMRNANQSILMGQHYRWAGTKSGFMYGGASYVLSARALRDLVVIGMENSNCILNRGSEDIEVAKCLQSVNVTIWSSLAIDRKETFHAERLGVYLLPPRSYWLQVYSWNKNWKYGPDCCANFSISFHHLQPRDMYLYEHLLYRTKVHNGPLRTNVFLNTTETVELHPKK